MAYSFLLPPQAQDAGVEYAHFCTPDAAIWICDPPGVYRPRHPETTVFYQVFEQHFDSYVAAYEERFEPRSGPPRRVVSDSVEQFLACGRLQGGFARLRCPSCKSEHLVAFSCRTRNFCNSCQAKRAALFADKLANDILPPVAYRHWTFTIPKAIRGLFERERRLLSLLSRTAYEAVRRSFQALFDRKDVRPGCVLSIQTFGSYGANFHPHCHAIISDGVWTRRGEFLELPSLDTASVCELFRRLLLQRLHQEERLSEGFMENLLSWVHPGFSVFAGEPLSPQDPEQLERLARYITRPPLPADSIRRHDGLIELTTPPDPRTGSTLRLFDPLDWIHAVTAHIPDRGRHCVRYYGAFANRARSPKVSCDPQIKPASGGAASPDTTSESESVRASRASWARLIKKIFEVDPLLCSCGAEMKVISYITDPRVVDRILRHLESPECDTRDPFEPRAPPQAGGNCLQ